MREFVDRVHRQPRSALVAQQVAFFPRAHQRSLRRDAEHDFAWAPDKALDRRGYPAGSVRFG